MKKLFLPLFFLLFVNLVYSQKDSVHALFEKTPHIKLPLKYSYLQWELGYAGFNLGSTFLNGASVDLIGLVFNQDLDIAIGFEEAGNANAPAPIGTPVSYSSFYLKFEPMLFPEKLFNIAIPLKFSASDMSFATSYSQNYYGHGRRRGNPGYRFFAFTPGADVFINIFRAISFGVGMNYRLAFSMPAPGSYSDYDNFSFSALIRFKLFPHKNRPKNPNDYYTPQQRFQQQ